MEDRIESLKNQIQILETKVDDEARFSIGLAMAGSQLVDISGNPSRVMLHDSWNDSKPTHKKGVTDMIIQPNLLKRMEILLQHQLAYSMRVKTVIISCLFKEIHSKVNKLHRL